MFYCINRLMRLMSPLLLCLTLMAGVISQAQASITVTDMKNRQVTLAGPAKRIVLAESRHIVSLALLQKDPVSDLVGWGDDLQRWAPQMMEQIVQRYPEASKVPVVGNANTNSFSIEATIAAKPDLVIFSMYSAPPANLDRLDAAHIPYVFIDFFQDPLNNTVPSIQLLGKVLGEEEQAQRFIVFWQQHMDGIKSRVARTDQRPTVLFHVNPNSSDCCHTSGTGNATDFIALAGGHNLGADILKTPTGQLSAEHVISRNPDFYLAAGGSLVTNDGLIIGPGATAQQVDDSMKHILQAPVISQLPAVKAGNAGGIWLLFFDSPLYFVGIEAMAKMFHPAEFADVDPDNTLQELTEHYLSVPMSGVFWTPFPAK